MYKTLESSSLASIDTQNGYFEFITIKERKPEVLFHGTSSMIINSLAEFQVNGLTSWQVNE